jgi:hypothetical protein
MLETLTAAPRPQRAEARSHALPERQRAPRPIELEPGIRLLTVRPPPVMAAADTLVLSTADAAPDLGTARAALDDRRPGDPARADRRNQSTMSETMQLNLHAVSTDTQETALAPSRLQTIKRAYNTRRIAPSDLAALHSDPGAAPRAGDLVLARVERIGKHASLELTDSRRSTLFVGDEVLVAYAARYAPDQFEARVPADLGPCHLAASGGVAAEVISRHGAVSAPTELRPLGLLVDAQGLRVNLERAALPRACGHGPRPLTLASLGTSMNAGKTTAAAHLIHGLKRAGLRVGGAKITGTGSGNDPGLLRDAGADWVLDFTDCGYASTFGLDLPALQDILHTVQTQMHAHGAEVLVVEVADGLLQRETSMLLRSPAFAQGVDGCLFSPKFLRFFLLVAPDS